MSWSNISLSSFNLFVGVISWSDCDNSEDESDEGAVPHIKIAELQ